MKALFHSIEEICKLYSHLKPGETITSTLTKFCNLHYLGSANFAYSYADLVSYMAIAMAGDIIFLKGEAFYMPNQIAYWDIKNRSQLANALRVNPSIFGVIVAPGVNIKVIAGLEEIPYLLNDIESGSLVSQNIVTISLITHEDFTT